MALLMGQYAYSKIDQEDPEDKKHRQAQSLIYKILLQADDRRSPSFFRIRICKLKVKIGKRIKKLRKSMSLGMSAARVGVYKQVIIHMKTWKRLFQPGNQTINVSGLQPSVFARGLILS